MKEIVNIFNGNKLSNTTSAQKSLMYLICKKIRDNASINKQEIIDLYVGKGQRLKQWTVGNLLEDGTTRWVSGNYASWELDMKATNWLLYNIGSLVRKGYLTVIPKIDFKGKEIAL